MYDDELFIDKLPKSLSKEELQILIKQAKDGSKEARDKLITHNIRLVLYEINTKFKNVNYDKKDLVSIGNLGLVKAVDTYDLSKKFEFSTYAARCIDNEILMFLRKIKKDSRVNINSLNDIIFDGKDGSEIKLEDQLSDDRDLVEECENAEIYKAIREIVKDLPGRDREIIRLHFGFYNDKIYTQNEIANKFHLNQVRVSRIIAKNVKQIGEILDSKGLIELRSIKHNLRKESEEEMKKLQTIYEYFKEYTKEQVDEMLTKLTEKERELVMIRYGEDLNNPVSTKLTKEQTDKFYGSLVPKMKRLLSNLTKEIKPRKSRQKEEKIQQVVEQTQVEEDNIVETEQVEEELITSTESQEKPLEVTSSNNKEMTKEDYIKVLELLRTLSFTQMMNSLSVKEAVIISLRLGYIDGKYFSTESISEFLGIEPIEVIETTKKVLLVYKDNINSLIDNLVEIVTEKSLQK